MVEQDRGPGHGDTFKQARKKQKKRRMLAATNTLPTVAGDLSAPAQNAGQGAPARIRTPAEQQCAAEACGPAAATAAEACGPAAATAAAAVALKKVVKVATTAANNAAAVAASKTAKASEKKRAKQVAHGPLAPSFPLAAKQGSTKHAAKNNNNNKNKKARCDAECVAEADAASVEPESIMRRASEAEAATTDKRTLLDKQTPAPTGSDWAFLSTGSWCVHLQPHPHYCAVCIIYRRSRGAGKVADTMSKTKATVALNAPATKKLASAKKDELAPATAPTRKKPLATKATPAAGAAAKAAVPTVTRRAGDGAAMLRVLGKAMQFFAPQAKRALAACFLHLPVDQRTPPHDDGDAAQLTISVEAVGSGIVIAPALQVYRDTTVGALKALIEGRCVPGSSGAIRVFVGHGGEELANDLQSVRAAAVADGATLVLVRILPQETLLRLFEATGGGQWRRRRGWGPSSTALLSAWQGVECNGGGGVVTLNLGDNNLCGACMQGVQNVRLVRTAFVSRPHATGNRYLACVGAFG